MTVFPSRLVCCDVAGWCRLEDGNGERDAVWGTQYRWEGKQTVWPRCRSVTSRGLRDAKTKCDWHSPAMVAGQRYRNGRQNDVITGSVETVAKLGDF